MWFHMVWHTFFFSTFQLPFVLPERTVSDHLSKFQAPSGTPPVEILEYIFIYCLFYPAFLFGAEIFSRCFFPKTEVLFCSKPQICKKSWIDDLYFPPEAGDTASVAGSSIWGTEHTPTKKYSISTLGRRCWLNVEIWNQSSNIIKIEMSVLMKLEIRSVFSLHEKFNKSVSSNWNSTIFVSCLARRVFFHQGMVELP